MTRDISSYHMMQVTFILRHGSDRNHCLSHQSTVHTAGISKACGLLTEIIVFLRVFVFLFCCCCFLSVNTATILKACGQLTEIIVFLFFCLFVCFYQSTRQPYWKLVDFWLKLSCVPSVNNPHGGHIESLWISDWNHRVFVKSTVHTTTISKACVDVAMSGTLVICKPARDVLILDAWRPVSRFCFCFVFVLFVFVFVFNISRRTTSSHHIRWKH